MRQKHILPIVLCACTLCSCAKIDTQPELVTECGVDAAQVIEIAADELSATYNHADDDTDNTTYPNVEIVYGSDSSNEQPISTGSSYSFIISNSGDTDSDVTTAPVTTAKPTTTTQPTTDSLFSILPTTGTASLDSLMDTLSVLPLGKSFSDDNLSMCYKHKTFTEMVAYTDAGIISIITANSMSDNKTWKDYIDSAVLIFDDKDYYLDIDLPISVSILTPKEAGATKATFQKWVKSWREDDIAKYFGDYFKVQKTAPTLSMTEQRLRYFGLTLPKLDYETTLNAIINKPLINPDRSGVMYMHDQDFIETVKVEGNKLQFAIFAISGKCEDKLSNCKIVPSRMSYYTSSTDITQAAKDAGISEAEWASLMAYGNIDYVYGSINISSYGDKFGNIFESWLKDIESDKLTDIIKYLNSYRGE